MNRHALPVVTAVVVAGACISRQASDMLSCRPTELTQESTLELSFQMPDPEALAIRAPDGTYFFVVWERGRGDPPALHPLMSREQFTRLSKLALPVRTFKASPWTAGRDENELVFVAPDTYECV